MTDDDDQLPDVSSSSEAVDASAPEPERLPEPRPEPGGLAVSERVEPPHAAKFQFLFGALAAVALVAIAIAAIGVTTGGSPGNDTASGWSSWKPEDDDPSSGAAQIAAHVAPRYRMTGGTQLVGVEGGPLTYNDPLSGAPVPMKVAVREAPADGGDIVFPKGDGVLYRLCGFGPDCAFDKGKPSESRAVLLNREALELALYSFRYLDDVDQVVVFLPPVKPLIDKKTGKKTDVNQPQAVHFERGDVETALALPVTSLLGTEAPTVRSAKSLPGADAVERLTAANRFGFRLQPANSQAEIFVVLEPLGTPQPTTTTGSSGLSQG
ncbi:MAG: hypothetical protein JHC95_02950 [Solirubrobacteraceae bacterium]|nr:hypothetical protein [Solirubrobacteraceae bacterium]